MGKAATGTESAARFAGMALSSTDRRGTTVPEGEAEGPAYSAAGPQEHRAPRTAICAVAGSSRTPVEGTYSVEELPSRPPAKRQASLLRSGEYDYELPRRGDIREGVILAIGEHDLVVDIGAKRDATVPPRDLDLLDEEYVAGLQVGDSVPVYILQADGRRGGLVASLNLGLRRNDWLRAQEMLDSGEVVEGEVNDANRGGVVVTFGRLRGFVPNSHLTSIPRRLRGDRLGQAKSDLVGQTLQLAVIEVNQRRRDLVLSERVAEGRRAEQILQELGEGDIRNGTVTNIVDFGAFVDLGGIDGLIHISELDWAHVEHPRHVVAVGDEIQVYVVSVDRERKRVGLSRKRLLPDPWHTIGARVHPGQIVEGRVTGVASFGFFVDVGEGVEGLVPASEMLGGPTRLSDIVPGDKVTVRVLSVDEWKRRISLRLEENGQSAERRQVPFRRPEASHQGEARPDDRVRVSGVQERGPLCPR